MLDEALKRYKIYEYIKGSSNITEEMSNTKKIISKLVAGDKNAEEYCRRKMLEEWQEVKDAMVGKHFHENMTKREILVNEISQYIYWQTIIAVSKNTSCEEFNEEGRIREILKDIDITKIGEKEDISVKEIIMHDLQNMQSKKYLLEVL